MRQKKKRKKGTSGTFYQITTISKGLQVLCLVFDDFQDLERAKSTARFMVPGCHMNMSNTTPNTTIKPEENKSLSYPLCHSFNNKKIIKVSRYIKTRSLLLRKGETT